MDKQRWIHRTGKLAKTYVKYLVSTKNHGIITDKVKYRKKTNAREQGI